MHSTLWISVLSAVNLNAKRVLNEQCRTFLTRQAIHPNEHSKILIITRMLSVDKHTLSCKCHYRFCAENSPCSIIIGFEHMHARKYECSSAAFLLIPKCTHHSGEGVNLEQIIDCYYNQ